MVAITEEMLESVTVVRISNLLPNLFYMENYHLHLQSELANHLFLNPKNMFSKYMFKTNHTSSSSTSKLYSNQQQEQHSFYQEHVYILSVQESGYHRVKRQTNIPNRSIDVLIAVYNSKLGAFFQPHEVAQALTEIIDRLATEFGGLIEVVTDLCTPQVCYYFFKC